MELTFSPTLHRGTPSNPACVTTSSMETPDSHKVFFGPASFATDRKSHHFLVFAPGTCKILSFAAASQARHQSPAVHFVIAPHVVARAESWYLDRNAGDLDVFVTPQGTRSSIWAIRDPGLAIDSDLGRSRLTSSALLTTL